MPKRKANWWPPSILSDPDVLSVDDEGRFVLCKICHVHYAVHGGKKPKPVIMNSNFRTRAWDVHKERTNSHRLQKQQERLQQAKTQQQQGEQTQVTDTQSQGQQQSQSAQTQQQQLQSSQGQTETQAQSSRPTPNQVQVLTQALPHQVQGQGQTPAPLTQQTPVQQGSLRSQSGTQVPQQQQQLELEETKDATGDQLQTRNSPIERPTSNINPETITAATMSGPNSMQGNGVMNGVGKRLAQSIPAGASMQRRRIFRAGSPRSSMYLLAESETMRRPNAHTYERHSFMAVGTGNHMKRIVPNDHVMAMEQADSSARWRHMHDDVSRALSAAPRRRQQGPSSYTSGELRAARTLVQTETGDLGSNNSERVAKKLRSLNAEYHASNMRHGDALNMRHTDVFDRRSAGYKEYWGTLRDVYTSSGTMSGSVPVNSTTYRKSHHRSNPSTRPLQDESKETEADSTTPDDSGSSEDAFKPAVVVHDASLFNAIERLTEATSKQIANLYQKEAADTREALVGLTSVMTDLRVQHGNAFNRIIELQEKHLKTMESILKIKLRKEAARNAKNSSSNNESTSAGSNPESSTNEVSVASDEIADGGFCGQHQ